MSKRAKYILAAGCVIVLLVGIAHAAVQSTLTQREVRDPRKLETILESNFAQLVSSTNIAASTAIAHTSGGVYTQTVSVMYYDFDNSAVVTQRLSNPVQDGQMVVFFNNAATNVVFDDSDTNLDLDGTDCTLGQGETLALRGDGASVWHRAYGTDMDGENLLDDSVDDDSLDIADVSDDIAADIAEGELADSIVVSADIKDGEIVNADISASAAIAESKLATSGLGTVVASAASATEGTKGIVQTTITITNVTLTATDGSDEGESAKIFDCDDGMFVLLGAVADMSIITSAGATGTVMNVAVGTAAAGDDNALTSTEADVVPQTVIDPSGAGETTNAFDAVLATSLIFDGTGTAKDLYLNLAIDDDNMSADVTNVFSGTLTLYSTLADDN